MQTLKKLAIAIIILLMTSIALVTITVYPTQAQLATTQPVSGPLPAGAVPSIMVDSLAFLSFRPNPVGVGQTILVNMWTEPPINVARNFVNTHVVTITKPDGTKVTMGPMNSYAGDSTAWFEYIVDQIGTWKLKFEFVGMYFPAGRYLNGYIVTNSSGTILDSAYYKPASTVEQTLTVQQEAVWSWPAAALPTDYWTRPISPENREWWVIAGNYPGNGVVGGGSSWPEDTNPYIQSTYGFTPYVQAPNTAHVVWKQEGALAGLIGGSAGIYGLGGSPGNPSVIFGGRCYQTQTVPINGVPTSCAVSYDLRTGQQYYAIPTTENGVTPQYISFSRRATGSVPGSGADQAYSVTLISVGNRLIKINPYTGALTLNVTGMSGTFYQDPYVLSIQTNNSAAGTRLINWTTDGSNTDFRTRIISNISFPMTTIGYADFEAGVATNKVSTTPNGTGVSASWQLFAASMVTGQLLWNITLNEKIYNLETHVADHGKIALLMMTGEAAGRWKCWDVYSGKLLWISEAMDYPWSSDAFGAYGVQSAYGMFYRMAYDGVFAFNWTDGKIVWKYKAPANPYETPYTDENGATVYSFNSNGKVADGKVYVANTEHSPTYPITRGWRLHCINATKGQGIWNITGNWNIGAMADNYLTASNSYDGYMYVFGKGKSVTTVQGPLTATPKGQGIVIQGTVLDTSPAQPDTPCVSKKTMTTQMEYLHMQHPIDGIWHNETIIGVPVSLTAIDSSGSYIDLGTVTTDGYYGTFSKTWVPDKEGDYKIVASFAGDDSYGSSAASTAIFIGPAPASTDTEQKQVTVPDYTMTIIAGVIAIIIAVIISAAIVGIILYRKK